MATNFYRLSGTAGERLSFHGLSALTGASSVAWTLYGPGDQYVASGFNGADFSATLGSTGTYILAVSGTNAGNTSVTYSFNLSDAITTTSTMTLGQEVKGAIQNLGDEAIYTFSGSTGVTIDLIGISAASGMYAVLTAPGGSQLFGRSIISSSVFCCAYLHTVLRRHLHPDGREQRFPGLL